MNQVFHYLKWSGRLVPDSTEAEARQNAINKSAEGSIWILAEQTPEAEIRSSQHNKYLWGAVYPAFCPDNFSTPQDVHKHFTAELLSVEDLVDITEEEMSEFVNKIYGQKSKAHKIKIIPSVDTHKVIIQWVRSTASLTKKQFIDYIERVKDFGATLGIQFLDITQIKEN